MQGTNPCADQSAHAVNTLDSLFLCRQLLDCRETGCKMCLQHVQTDQRKGQEGNCSDKFVRMWLNFVEKIIFFVVPTRKQNKHKHSSTLMW